MRAFLALPMESIASDLLAHFQRLQQLLMHEDLKWSAPHNFHLTLCFLGDIKTKQIEQLDRITESVAQSALGSTIQFDTIRWFPNPMKPKVLALIPEDNNALMTLQTQLRGDLRRAGFHVEGRSFKPHVTLARCKGLHHGQALAEEIIDLHCSMEEIILYSSQLTSDGPIYRPVFSHPLAY